MNSSSVIFSHLSFAWPDGHFVLDDVSVSFTEGRTGLIGANGSGKTTVLRLIAGDLVPVSGTLTVTGDVCHLPQTIAYSPTATLADLLGAREKIEALRAIESGSTDPAHFDALADDWQIETRIDRLFHDYGLAYITSMDLDRPVRTLSGGEAMVLAIAGCRLSNAPITLLDEPTNNLDSVLRESVVQMVRAWPGTLILVSHDIDLLEEMDTTAELYGHTLTLVAGPYSVWDQARTQEQAAAVNAEKAAEATLRTARQQQIATTQREAKNLVRGKKKALKEGIEKGARDKMRGTAEAAAARSLTTAESRVDTARRALDEASQRVRDDEHIRIDLPDPGVHASRTILELTWADQCFIMKGPERVALTGRNGVGKTSLIEQTLGLSDPRGAVLGQLSTARVGYLPQRLDTLDENANAIDNVLVKAPSATPADVRARLARMLLRGDSVFRPVSTLSGGERFRVSLAQLLFADPPAQLLILDEPTNNLDHDSVNHLVEALSTYRGAILVVSHDARFLARLGVSIRLTLSETGLSVNRI